MGAYCACINVDLRSCGFASLLHFLHECVEENDSVLTCMYVQLKSLVLSPVLYTCIFSVLQIQTNIGTYYDINLDLMVAQIASALLYSWSYDMHLPQHPSLCLC